MGGLRVNFRYKVGVLRRSSLEVEGRVPVSVWCLQINAYFAKLPCDGQKDTGKTQQLRPWASTDG